MDATKKNGKMLMPKLKNSSPPPTTPTNDVVNINTITGVCVRAERYLCA
jgi:hypothetical protein